MYTTDMLRAGPLLTVTTNLIGQSIIVRHRYIHRVLFRTIAFLLSLTTGPVKWLVKSFSVPEGNGISETSFVT